MIVDEKRLDEEWYEMFRDKLDEVLWESTNNNIEKYSSETHIWECLKKAMINKEDAIKLFKIFCESIGVVIR